MGASLASCFSRETPGEEPVLEEQSPGFPKKEPDERPGRPGDAVPGDGPPAPPPCTYPCECCYYSLSSKTARGAYTGYCDNLPNTGPKNNPASASVVVQVSSMI